MREQRRLAAILAADVVGYSSLMGRHESGTLARLREHRKQRLEPILGRYGGRMVKLMGDGALAEFPSAVDALGAAITFQQAVVEANVGQAADTAIVLRIGIHLGDLIINGDDLHGDGVNVATRLEGEASPGSIVMPAAVNDATGGRLAATFEDLGMVEEITTAPSRFRSMFAIARNSSFTFKDKVTDVRAVRRRLGVRYVLEGSVRKAGPRLRITGQLIECQTGHHLWAGRIANLRIAAAADALNGNPERARTLAIRAHKQDPTEPISRLTVYVPSRRKEDLEVFARGLRLAGVAE